MSSDITAFGDKIVAKKIETASKTSAGFYLPDSAKEEAKVAEVVAVGNAVQEIKVGDRIVYAAYNSPVKIDGVEYVFMRADEVFFKVGK